MSCCFVSTEPIGSRSLDWLSDTTLASLAQQDFTALRFAMSSQILAWLFSLYVLTIIALVDVAGYWSETARIKKRLQIGFTFTCFYAYTGTLAISAISADCRNGNGTTIKDYSSTSNMKDDINKFCNKVGASTTFMWFMAFCVFIPAALRFYKTSIVSSPPTRQGNADEPLARVHQEQPPPQSEGIVGGHDL